MKFLLTALILFSCVCSFGQKSISSESFRPVVYGYPDASGDAEYNLVLIDFDPLYWLANPYKQRFGYDAKCFTWGTQNKYDRTWKLADFGAYPDDGINDLPIFQRLVDSALYLPGITALLCESGIYSYGTCKDDECPTLFFNHSKRKGIKPWITFLFEGEKEGTWLGTCFGCCDKKEPAKKAF